MSVYWLISWSLNLSTPVNTCSSWLQLADGWTCPLLLLLIHAVYNYNLAAPIAICWLQLADDRTSPLLSLLAGANCN